VYILLTVDYVSISGLRLSPLRLMRLGCDKSFQGRVYFLGMACLVQSLVTRIPILTTDTLIHCSDRALLSIAILTFPKPVDRLKFLIDRSNILWKKLSTSRERTRPTVLSMFY